MTQGALDILFNRLQTDGFSAMRDADPQSALEAFYLAVVSYGHQDLQRATASIERGLEFEPENPLLLASRQYLERVTRGGLQGVYTDPEAFGAYIRGGGNVPLYQAVSQALRSVYEGYPALRLLDIGVGDGLALIPALTENIQEVTLVEPSAALLGLTREKLDALGISHAAHQRTLQDFIGGSEGHWDIAQATFSLQSIPPVERPPLFRWLRDHSDRLLVVEFDVPQFAHPLEPAHVRSVCRRFQDGLLEYDQDRELVAQGFMIPVLFGFFDPTTARTNYEEPLSAWESQIRAGGFGQIESRVLFDYWWSPAFLIDARP